MPRKSERIRREQRLKPSSLLNIKMTPESAKKQERTRALKALEKAKELEQKRLGNGWQWIQEGKTRRLVKV